MNITRLKEIEALGVSPEELLEYALIKNDSVTVLSAFQEHDLMRPGDALTFAIARLSKNSVTYLLKLHGYQPIPKRQRKQSLREAALSH